MVVAAVAIAATLVVLAALAVGSRYAGTAAHHKARAEEVTATPLPVSAPAGASDTPVEVPNVTGRPFVEAEVVLSAAGLVVASKGDTSSPDGRAIVVTAQTPAPGTKVSQGDQVSLVLAASGTAATRPLVVVLDPGHQAKPDLSPEPIGPGSPETKEKATAGACGVATKRQEAEVALEVSLRMKTRLEAAGVRVIMTRVSNAVDLGNVERAQIANRAQADLFVRVHADAASSPSIRGVQVLYPEGNAWVGPITAASKRAAGIVEARLVNATGAPGQGISGVSDISGFNWSKVPAILVETGFLSNADEDRLLANPGYQDKVAAGAVAGILAYLGR